MSSGSRKHGEKEKISMRDRSTLVVRE